MSNLTVTNLNGVGASAGQAKAWLVAKDVTGTPTVQNSSNVSSIVDVTNGMYTPNWTSPFNADENYSVGINNQHDQSATQNHHGMTGAISRYVVSGVSMKAGSCAISFGIQAGSVYDEYLWNLTAHGDLA